MRGTSGELATALVAFPCDPAFRHGDISTAAIVLFAKLPTERFEWHSRAVSSISGILELSRSCMMNETMLTEIDVAAPRGDLLQPRRSITEIHGIIGAVSSDGKSVGREGRSSEMRDSIYL